MAYDNHNKKALGVKKTAQYNRGTMLRLFKTPPCISVGGDCGVLKRIEHKQ